MKSPFDMPIPAMIVTTRRLPPIDNIVRRFLCEMRHGNDSLEGLCPPTGPMEFRCKKCGTIHGE